MIDLHLCHFLNVDVMQKYSMKFLTNFHYAKASTETVVTKNIDYNCGPNTYFHDFLSGL